MQVDSQFLFREFENRAAGMWKNIGAARALGSLPIVPAACVGYPLVSHRLVNRKSKSMEKDK